MVDDDMIRIAGVVKESTVDGPGFRYVIFTQGCPHHCEGCHNPATHAMDGGRLERITTLANDISINPLLKGVTLSGGEPFMQAKNLVKLLELLDLNRYTVMTYTGFKYEYLLENANKENGFLELLKLTDVLIDGKFEISLKSSKVKFRGSSNQRAIDVKSSLKENKIVIHEF
jgi:anaerobic ribonucleoside-triphosphate reductase activating protein